MFKKILVFCIILLIYSGCGSNGRDGDVYLRIRAVLEPTNFSIENEDIPTNFEYDVYYIERRFSFFTRVRVTIKSVLTNIEIKG